MSTPTRRSLLSLPLGLPLLSLTGTLAACGNRGPTAAGAGATAAPGAGASGAGAGFPLTLDHFLGRTTIPKQPTRVVALDSSYVDAVILCRSDVLGYTQYHSTGRIPDYLGEPGRVHGAKAQSVGTLTEPSLEKIASLQPDLIISAAVRHKSLYGQLSAIAPTVMSETTGPTWKENVTFTGKVLGRSAEAGKALDDYHARAKKVGAAIKAKGDPTISVVRFMEGETRLYQRKSFSGHVLADADLRRPPSQDVDEFAAAISEERITDADADVIFVTTAIGSNKDAKSKGPEQTRARFEANPLWAKLKGRKISVEDQLWMTAVGVQGAHHILDGLAEAFGVDPART